jgi:DnaJ-class molecular chaperone
MHDPYKTLGLNKTASQDEIKKAYRNLVKKYHPDLNPGNKKAEEKFKEISHAYDLIGTPAERTKFDNGETSEQQQQQQEQAWNQRYGQRSRGGQSQGPRADRYTQSFADQFGGEDFFEELFRAHRGQNQQQAANYQMNIGFQESIIGAEKVISLPNGKNLNIKIPPGITSGTKLRLKPDDGPEIFIEIKIDPLAGWTRIGADLETEVPISFIEGILGAEISVRTMYGPVMLKIPPGVNTGTKLRIKGKGVKVGQETGNQIVKLKVMLPKESPELANQIKNWKGSFDYNPRDT